ncbi:MAG: hypothetical protein V4490_06830, partial [Pseudomonadota bacterium]
EEAPASKNEADASKIEANASQNRSGAKAVLKQNEANRSTGQDKTEQNNNTDDDNRAEFLNGQKLNGFEDLETIKERLLKDESFLYPIALLGVKPELVPKWLDAFHRWLKFSGEQLKQEKDYRSHFRNWITRIPNSKSANPDDYQPIQKGLFDASKPKPSTQVLKSAAELLKQREG